MRTFEKLESRYIFTGTLVLDQAMHIGSGESDERTDSLFTRSKDILYIPGSSLRGAMRSTVERIAYALESDPERAKSVSCLLSQYDDPRCISVCKETKDAYSTLGEASDEKALKEFLEKDGHICDTCRVFGSTHFASKVKVTDLYPSTDCIPQDVIRTNVGIDRDTETASQTALFNMQVVEKGARFDFELIAENLCGKEEWGLLCIGLWEMIRGQGSDGAFYIGAKSAAGLGKCYLKKENLMIQYFEGRTELRQYLKSGEMPNRMQGDAAVEFVKSKVQSYLDGGS